MALFSPETWPFSLDLLPHDAHLVGGSVRDRLLNRTTSYLDLDFVLPKDAIKTAANLANTYSAGFVVLDKTREIARVIFDTTTVDIVKQQGDTLEADLHRRDYTINAIAYHPRTHQLIDPLNGQADLKTKTIRTISERNLAADAVRLLRAYRQAAQLNFTIAPDTQAAIQQLARKLILVSRERIQKELDALLATPTSSRYLAPMLEAQLLKFFLPSFSRDRIQKIQAIEQAIATFQTNLPSYANQLKRWTKPTPPNHHRSWIKAAKLSQMVSPQPELAEEELIILKYSRNEIQVIITLLEAQPQIEAMRQNPLSQAQQFFLFKQVGTYFPAISLLALAQGVPFTTLQPLIERFLNPEDKIAHAPTLITGTELIQQLKIEPGPQIGAILKAVESAQAEGRIQNKESAIAFIQQWQNS